MLHKLHPTTFTISSKYLVNVFQRFIFSFVVATCETSFRSVVGQLDYMVCCFSNYDLYNRHVSLPEVYFVVKFRLYRFERFNMIDEANNT